MRTLVWINNIIANRTPVMSVSPLEKMYRNGEFTQYGGEVLEAFEYEEVDGPDGFRYKSKWE